MRTSAAAAGSSVFFACAPVGLAFATFVHLYEQPTLARQFGAEYEAYRRAVPGWWPRLHPWDPGDAAGR